MNTELISKEAAQKEWIGFLQENDAFGLIPDESLKDSTNKEDREEYRNHKQMVDTMARAISFGSVIIEDGIITQKLKTPIESKNNDNFRIDSLTYNQRWTAKDREEMFKNINTDKKEDGLLMTRRMLSKITGVDASILLKIDGKDMKICDYIVSVFFM